MTNYSEDYEIEYISVKYTDHFRKYYATEYDFYVNWERNIVIMTPLDNDEKRDVFPMSSICKIHEMKVYND